MSQNFPPRLHLTIVTPEKLLVETEADEVELPGLDGYLGILPGHRPLNTALGNGTITFRMGSQEERYAVRGGFAEVSPESVLVITEISEVGVDRTNEEGG